jgi:catechol 2,3-dioxygenase-like lactoylglutathione lyase family enzyme
VITSGLVNLYTRDIDASVAFYRDPATATRCCATRTATSSSWSRHARTPTHAGKNKARMRALDTQDELIVSLDTLGERGA